MMKKAIKKLLAALLAVAMVCAMAIPAFAYDTKEDLNTKHEYDAFQIFNGDVTGNDTDGFKISNVTWGKNIPHPEDFLEKLTKDSTIGGEFETDFTPQEAVAVISKCKIPIITASLSRVLYATISTRIPMQTGNPSFKVVTPVASNFQWQVII